MMGDRKAHLFITVEVLVAIQSPPLLFPPPFYEVFVVTQAEMPCSFSEPLLCGHLCFLQAAVQTRVGYLRTCLC